METNLPIVNPTTIETTKSINKTLASTYPYRMQDTRFVAEWGEGALEDLGMLTEEITPLHIEEIFNHCIKEYINEGRIPNGVEIENIIDIMDEGSIYRAAKIVFDNHVDKILLDT